MRKERIMIFWHSLENDLTVTHTINIDTIQIFHMNVILDKITVSNIHLGLVLVYKKITGNKNQYITPMGSTINMYHSRKSV